MACFTAAHWLYAVRRAGGAVRAKWRYWLQQEATGGVFLLIAAGAALSLANSPLRALYESFLHMPLLPFAGSRLWRFDVSFLVNDGLMTLFFLSVGAEIRQEIHNGVLSELKQAVLPIIAAIGGVCLPALLYSAFNAQTAFAHGWAVPTATDIAFAVGVLALLGKIIPAELRIILLALAVIDDIIAVLIIALFYSGGLNAPGAALVIAAIMAVMLLQFLGFSSLLLYASAAVILWFGLWQTGIHPSLAGIILGLLTPVAPLASAPATHKEKSGKVTKSGTIKAEKTAPAPAVRQKPAGNGLSPVRRLQKALHFWVIFGIMPLFAFVNAGINLGDINFSAAGSAFIFPGVAGGLWLGKPLGVLLASFLAVKSGLCRLPPAVGWRGMVLVGLLAGIGFTMAIFVSMLAFADKSALSLAVSGVLCGSAFSAVLGLGYGLLYRRTLLAAAGR
ncbi:Na+/H+ antiporter NhaA [Candidatus Tokpelaia sp.]|uniref:Na+/H+ antiporter NhaA n=1 Tax=Candidatus Tokpelaia sp. TaxID=2233777 RepID=UPI0012386E83|nr:Na+/H+ antiporter NhaA [Candidatus Tokpelaia sp.]KAA6405314.1 Na+/H+ antiporter NhaA [Candidatus Tokpelaia sp.]